MEKIDPSEITPEPLYASRRKFIGGMGAMLASTLFLDACKRTVPIASTGDDCESAEASQSTDELGDQLTEGGGQKSHPLSCYHILLF